MLCAVFFFIRAITNNRCFLVFCLVMIEISAYFSALTVNLKHILVFIRRNERSLINLQLNSISRRREI